MLEKNKYNNTFEYIFGLISFLQLKNGTIHFKKKETKFKKLFLINDDEQLVAMLTHKDKTKMRILFTISNGSGFGNNHKEILFEKLREENQQQIISHFEGRVIECS